MNSYHAQKIKKYECRNNDFFSSTHKKPIDLKERHSLRSALEIKKIRS